MRDAPSDVSHDLEVVRNVRIPIDDGAASLSADLFLPRGTVPGPSLVNLLPYQKDTRGGIGQTAAAERFAAAGYASLLVDPRGLGASGGDVRRPFDPAEGDDGVAAVEWAARQPWSNGRVGMWGVSYGALLTYRTAARRPEPLQAIIPIVGMTDPERDFVHPRGMTGCISAFGMWALELLTLQLLPPTHRDGAGEWDRVWRKRLEAEPWILDLVRNPPGEAIWRTRRVDLQRIQTPTLVVGGWQDVFCEAAVRAYEEIRAPKRLVVGPWMHSLPDQAAGGPVDFMQVAIEWWNRWLRDEAADEDSVQPVGLFKMGHRAQWESFARWPPDTDTLELAPSGQSTLGSVGHSDGRAVRMRSVVKSLDPTIGALAGPVGLPIRGCGISLDQENDDLRSLSFTSAPLDTSVHIVGRPEVAIEMTLIDGRLDGLVAQITDVDTRGRSWLITSGAVTAGIDRARTQLRAALAPTSYQVPAGHRIRLVIAGADFPRLWPHDPATIALHYGGARTWVRLPINPRGAESAAFDSARAGPASVAGDGAARSWLTRHLSRDRLAVTIGDHVDAELPGGGSLQLRTSVSAGVHRRKPTMAWVHGRSEAVLRAVGGDLLVVHVVLDVHDSRVTALGRLTVNGRDRFKRIWREIRAASRGS